MDRLVMLLVTMAVAFAVGLAWDRRPALDYRLPTPIIHPHLRFPGGAVTVALAERDAARRELATAQGQIAAQNKGLEALKAAQDAKLASADKAVQHAARNRPRVAAKVKALSEAIHPELNGVTLEAWNKADGDVVEALR